MLDIGAQLQNSHVLPPARVPRELCLAIEQVGWPTFLFGLWATGAFLRWRSLWRRAMTIEVDANDLRGVSEILRQMTRRCLE